MIQWKWIVQTSQYWNSDQTLHLSSVYVTCSSFNSFSCFHDNNNKELQNSSASSNRRMTEWCRWNATKLEKFECMILTRRILHLSDNSQILVLSHSDYLVLSIFSPLFYFTQLNFIPSFTDSTFTLSLCCFLDLDEHIKSNCSLLIPKTKKANLSIWKVKSVLSLPFVWPFE